MEKSAFSFVLPTDNFLDAKNIDDFYFAQALKNAYFCQGSTHPNPSVGAVIVRDSQILAEGFTNPVGGLHAEAAAIKQANGDVIGSTIYVSLEPCSHFGKTPPCVEAIVAAGIKRVVFGVLDPNPRVCSKGSQALQDHGLDVQIIANNYLRSAAESLIKPFKKYILANKPYVILKIATSRDQKIAACPGVQSKITGHDSDLVVHQLRRAIDCILIGANTLNIDKPKLTARLGATLHGYQPMKLVISSSLNLDKSAQLFADGQALVATTKDQDITKLAALTKLGVRIMECDKHNGQVSLVSMLSKLGELGITSLLVEAGALLLESCLKDNLADEIWWFQSKLDFGPFGLGVGDIPKKVVSNGYKYLSRHSLGDDELKIYKHEKI